MDTDASSRLGEPERVADNAVAAHRRRSFLARHCWARVLVFAITPVVALFEVENVFFATLCASLRQDWHKPYPYGIVSLMLVMSSGFLAAFYSELVTRCGVGKKWTLVSGAVLGVIAAYFQRSEAFHTGNSGPGLTAITVVQFALPLIISGLTVKRECYHGSPATAFLLVAISPLASYWTFSLLGFFTFGACYSLLDVLEVLIFGTMAVHGTLIRACSMFVLVDIIPSVVASFICCQLLLRSRRDRRWMLVSGGAIVLFATMQRIPRAITPFFFYSLSLRTCVIVWQLIIPAAICWWFMRRKHDQGQLQLAA